MSAQVASRGPSEDSLKRSAGSSAVASRGGEREADLRAVDFHFHFWIEPQKFLRSARLRKVVLDAHAVRGGEIDLLLFAGLELDPQPPDRLARDAVGQHIGPRWNRSEEHTSELQSRLHLVCRLL